MASKHQDKIVFGLSLLLVAGGAAGAWFYYQKQAVPALNKKVVRAGDEHPYTRVVPPVGLDPARLWAQPAPQRSGPNWIYEVFTSPYIYYNKVTRELDAVAPINIPPPKTFGLDLVAVMPGPFRLQLVGYKGQDGLFRNLPGHDDVIARAGRVVTDLNLEIRDFQVKDLPLDEADPASPRRTVAVATVADTNTGETTRLTTMGITMGGPPIAMLKTSDAPGHRGVPLTRGLVAGDTYVDPASGDTFKIDKVTENPATVTIIKTSADGAVETPKLLNPLPPKPARTPAAEPAGATGKPAASKPAPAK